MSLRCGHVVTIGRVCLTVRMSFRRAYIGVMGATRAERIELRTRNEKWKNVPLRIEMLECINCDACLRHCPSHFGAIFNHGPDVVIIPELCSGCDKCLPACPVNCIVPFPEWQEKGVPTEWWDEAGGANDPYS
jgi:electron transport complex protein RnfB